MVTGREAELTDQQALDAFVCAQSGESWAEDVEGYIGDLLSWRSEGGPGRRVRVYEDETGIVAVLAYRHLTDGEPGTGYFCYLLAVRIDRRRGQLGTQLMRGLIEHLAELEPGKPIAWMVNPSNTASVRLSMRFVVDEPMSDPEWPHDLEFSALLPGKAE